VGTTRLQLYNQALRICGERRLASLTENREPRHLLDQVWAEGGVDDVLEQGQWNFAMRAVQIDSDPSVDPAFGLAYGFTKPTDWIRTAGFCSDERFSTPLLEYKDEAGYWYADITPIYVRYVSNDSGFGAISRRGPGHSRISRSVFRLLDHLQADFRQGKDRARQKGIEGHEARCPEQGRDE
jgi:hypothetical protein